MTEQVHPGRVVQALAEVLEWVDLGREEWVAPEQVQAQQGSVFVQNAERLFLMRSEFPAPIRPVQNVVQRW